MCKDKNGKTVGYVPRNVSKQMHVFIKYGGRVEMKVNANDDIQKTCSKGFKSTLHVFCIFSARKNVPQI